MYEPTSICTWTIVIVTCGVSWLGFRNQSLQSRYLFHPPSILAGKEFHRIITSAFHHAGLTHLGLNMFSLLIFGRWIEFFHGPGTLLAIYFGAIIGGSLLSLYIHRFQDYRAYGASGGVCGVIFAHCFLFPGQIISMFLIPMPAWLYAILFLVGSFVALQRQNDNIGHDAHIGGAIFGLAVTAGMYPEVIYESPRMFATVCAASVLILVYLVKYPLCLSIPVFGKKEVPMAQRYGVETRPAALKVDAILDKISEHGIHSLTKEERAFLDSVSDKYRRRAESKKPDSELIF